MLRKEAQPLADPHIWKFSSGEAQQSALGTHFIDDSMLKGSHTPSSWLNEKYPTPSSWSHRTRASQNLFCSAAWIRKS